MIVVIIIIINCPGYDIKLHPVMEFRRGIMRLPFAITTSRSPLSKVWYLLALPETMKYRVGVRRGLVCLMAGRGSLALVGNPPSDGVTIKILVVVQSKNHKLHK